MIRRLLIANRGEIACRIIETARLMGIGTIAVYSEADARARHVRLADEAHLIGAAPADQSYLRADKILEVARATGADAIHPGYGFLSENADFAEAVAEAGMAFVGPPASAIRAMGLKDAAKALMEQAGVPVVPGYHGADQDPDLLAREAERIGYPVLIKARAGGGGRGMRLVEQAKDFAEALASAAREATSAFGDGAVLIEKYIQNPRHIEVQIFGDSHGNVVHLFERDCTLQRRHQKVIEEAPAPGMSDDVRAAMTRAAIEAGRAIAYQGAGTVEFIVDGADGLRADGFWFMEMNTRLQVEHPVTEEITGLDLVEWQLRVARGEPLPLRQDEITLQGHAFEARIYAEDPAQNFMPSPGHLIGLSLGDGPHPVRIDTGVEAGDEISAHYDPMIAKLTVWAETRAEALDQLSDALGRSFIAGITANTGFLHALSQHPDFVQFNADTGLIAREIDGLTAPAPKDDAARALAALFALDLDPGRAGFGWQLWGAAEREILLDDAPVRLQLGAGAQVTLGDLVLDDITRSGNRISARLGGRRITAYGSSAGGRLWLAAQGRLFEFTLPPAPGAAGADGASPDEIAAPMTGTVTQVAAAVGQAVQEGDVLITVEAMKMEHKLTAPRDGTVEEVSVAVGDAVSSGAILMRLEAET